MTVPFLWFYGEKEDIFYHIILFLFLFLFFYFAFFLFNIFFIFISLSKCFYFLFCKKTLLRFVSDDGVFRIFYSLNEKEKKYIK